MRFGGEWEERLCVGCHRHLYHGEYDSVNCTCFTGMQKMTGYVTKNDSIDVRSISLLAFKGVKSLLTINLVN
jgi:hypothetical protein